MVTLQKDGTWSCIVRREPATGATNNRLIVDDPLSVQYNGDMPIDQCQFVGIPFSTRLSDIDRRGDAAKDSARTADSLHPAVTVNNLGLVHPSHNGFCFMTTSAHRSTRL